MEHWSRAIGLTIGLTTAGAVASPALAQSPDQAKWLKDITAKDAALRESAVDGFAGCGVDCRSAIPKLAELYPKASAEQRASVERALTNLVIAIEARYSTEAQVSKKPASRVGPEAECRRMASALTPVVSKPPSDAELQAWMGASELLGRCGTATEVPVFVELLKASELFVRVSAAEGLGRIGPEAKDAIPALEAAASAASPGGIRDKYQRAIDRIRGKP